MSRSRAATPAGRSRATAGKPRRRANGSTRNGSAPKRQPPKRGAAKRQPAKPAGKRTPKRATTKRATTKRATTKRAPAKRPVAKRRAASAGRPGWARRLVAGISWRRRLAIFVVLLAAAGAGYLFWLRDSSWVAVTDVEVAGVTTSDRAEIVAALTGVAKEMTTLHADVGRIESTAERFPTIAAVDVDPNFPHGMRLEVRERPPKLFITAGADQVPVAGDGTVLAGVSVPEDQSLPVLPIAEIPASGRLSGEPLEQALVVGATPDPLLPLIEKVHYSDEFGVELIVRGGIEIRFGSGARAADKWASAAAVLADRKLDVATYVDVRVPERPAAGGAA